MPIKNYTTTKDAFESVGEIQAMLARRGAQRLMIEYGPDQRVVSVSFTISTPGGIQAVRLPSNVDATLEVLRRQKKTNSKVIATYDQAERVSWRILRDWLDAQLAILETEMVTIDQVLLPYFINRSGQSVYELFNNGQLMIEGGDR
ncbi:hypothetical protein DWY25_04520 [Holdemania filiformis]|uniref:Uncharacterized protein n=1 Tax=Holdemania filiformis TaxID=61171 RepID=A0A412G4H0_9FIRM|nr:hypothetical protein [Holdemania filiformis]RGR75505.1 hypothetical protein DWY25_04520 [Holdemania filiformis]